MIWNGTDPLQPDHEVAYRGWPTERVKIALAGDPLKGPWIVRANAQFLEQQTYHSIDGHHGPIGVSPYDLIPLQQKEQR